MTRPIPRLITLAISLLIGVLAANHVLADDYHHINALARKIHSKAKVLKNETRHYRHTPNYKRILHDVAELDRVACHLRDTAKHEGDLDHLAADITEIDNHFQHVQYLFDHTELSVSRYGHGFIKARTSHVKRLLDDIEKAISRICVNIASLRAATKPVLRGPTPHYSPYPKYGYDDRRFKSQRYDSQQYDRGPIVTRVETYNIPPAKVYRAPYGNKSNKHHYKHEAHDRNYPSPNYGGLGISIGGGNSKITFRF